MFEIVFPNRSFSLDISTFAQIDTTHWLLDMNHFVGESSIIEICIFLINSFTLPPEKALAVYIKSLEALSYSAARSRSPAPPPCSLSLGRIR
ncbi:hypothetical protein PHJA_000370000 [Phtheirospermum japonicum]|uniref:Uncharacterized protein n=1 Tax=Phtheirospermum japonicum TaxID=374723 RepID=A0A830BAY5_9LAMI|nr:hypothetical protein PHJA_000370000 [Phtheirospermum japonicum]